MWWEATRFLAVVFPPSSLALVKILTTVQSEETATLSVVRGADRLYLRCNPTFIATHIHSPIEFAGVFLHELLHVLLNHLRICPKQDITSWHIAMDAVINSTIRDVVERTVWAGRYEAAEMLEPFLRLYTTEQRASALLRPPPVGLKGTVAGHETWTPRWKEMYRAIFPPLALGTMWTSLAPTATEADVYSFLAGEEDPQVPLLLGSGPASDVLDGYSSNESVASALSRLVGEGNSLNRYTLQLGGLKHSEVFRSCLQRAAASTMIDMMVCRPSPRRTVVPPVRMSASDIICLSTGRFPMFFSCPPPPTDKPGCCVYLDVSGSMEAYLPWIYRCLIEVSREVNIFPFLFSTEVIPTTLQELACGSVATRTMTSFDCVIEHILTTSPAKAVVITDGIGALSEGACATITCSGIKVLAVVVASGGKHYLGGLQRFCTTIYKVPST